MILAKYCCKHIVLRRHNKQRRDNIAMKHGVYSTQLLNATLTTDTCKYGAGTRAEQTIVLLKNVTNYIVPFSISNMHN